MFLKSIEKLVPIRHFENESTFWKWKLILKMKTHFEEESTSLKMKAHFETVQRTLLDRFCPYYYYIHCLLWMAATAAAVALLGSATGSWSWICRLSRIYIMRSIILRIAQYAVIFPNCSRIKKEKRRRRRKRERADQDGNAYMLVSQTVKIRQSSI